MAGESLRHTKVQKHTVVTPAPLAPFIATVLVGAQPKRVQQLLKFRAVTVNGQIVMRAQHALQAGDVVEIYLGGTRAPARSLAGGLKLVFEDEHIIVVDKPPGLLTIATLGERTHTAYALLTEYVRTRESDDRVFIVHRLDQGTSGLLVFARTERAKYTLQDNWGTAEKRYQAVVQGTPEPPVDTIRSLLKENRGLEVYSTSADEGVLAITHYRVLQVAEHCSLVEVTLETGRKNQIRVHLAERGHPVMGDKKYGAQSDGAARLALHATYLSFEHPISGDRLAFTSPLPPRLLSLLRGRR